MEREAARIVAHDCGFTTKAVVDEQSAKSSSRGVRRDIIMVVAVGETVNDVVVVEGRKPEAAKES